MYIYLTSKKKIVCFLVKQTIFLARVGLAARHCAPKKTIQTKIPGVFSQTHIAAKPREP